jgi:acyl-CoA synthetase (AMP-forming)/AMP-acid ligase II
MKNGVVCQAKTTTQLCLRSGRLYNGDIGRMDEEGYSHIAHRKKDMPPRMPHRPMM